MTLAGGGHPAGVGQGDAATHTQPGGRCSAPIRLRGRAVPSAAGRRGGGRERKVVLPSREGLVLSAATAGSGSRPKVQSYTMGKIQIWS